MKLLLFVLTLAVSAAPLFAQVTVRGNLVITMAGPPIRDGMVIVEDGKITAVGPAADLTVPEGQNVLTARVVTPGLIDPHCVVGFSGYLNQAHDQDQLDRTEPIQPELRAIDGYNARERLVGWVRSFGVTTIHTGHAPGQLISGQTMIAKTRGNTVGEAVFVETAMIAASLGQGRRRSGRDRDRASTAPGTRSKAVALLRAELVRAREYAAKMAGEEKPDRDLRLEALTRVLTREIPLLITADRHHDILTALRLAAEFNLRIVLDSAAEAYELTDEIKAAGVPVLVHPTMRRPQGDAENVTMENAARLCAAGIEVAIQGGYESYVPKTRVVLFEAAIAASCGLSQSEALATITIDAARILGIDDRVGSLEVGKDGDIALYDGDPFEYTSHCIGVIIEGDVVSEKVR